MSTARARARRQHARAGDNADASVGKGLAGMSDTPSKRQKVAGGPPAKVQDGPPAAKNAGQTPASDRQDDCALAENDLSPKNREVEEDQMDEARGEQDDRSGLVDIAIQADIPKNTDLLCAEYEELVLRQERLCQYLGVNATELHRLASPMPVTKPPAYLDLLPYVHDDQGNLVPKSYTNLEILTRMVQKNGRDELRQVLNSRDSLLRTPFMIAGQPGVPGKFSQFLGEVIKAILSRKLDFREALDSQVDYLGATILHHWSGPNILTLFRMFSKTNIPELMQVGEHFFERTINRPCKLHVGDLSDMPVAMATPLYACVDKVLSGHVSTTRDAGFTPTKEKVRILLNLRADPNFCMVRHTKNYRNRSVKYERPLLYAAVDRCVTDETPVDIVKMLLDAKANPDVMDTEQGCSALFLSTRYKGCGPTHKVDVDISLYDLLLSAGASKELGFKRGTGIMGDYTSVEHRLELWTMENIDRCIAEVNSDPQSEEFVKFTSPGFCTIEVRKNIETGESVEFSSPNYTKIFQQLFARVRANIVEVPVVTRLLSDINSDDLERTDGDGRHVLFYSKGTELTESLLKHGDPSALLRAVDNDGFNALTFNQNTDAVNTMLKYDDQSQTGTFVCTTKIQLEIETGPPEPEDNLTLAKMLWEREHRPPLQLCLYPHEIHIIRQCLANHGCDWLEANGEFDLEVGLSMLFKDDANPLKDYSLFEYQDKDRLEILKQLAISEDLPAGSPAMSCMAMFEKHNKWRNVRDQETLDKAAAVQVKGETRLPGHCEHPDLEFDECLESTDDKRVRKRWKNLYFQMDLLQQVGEPASFLKPNSQCNPEQTYQKETKKVVKERELVRKVYPDEQERTDAEQKEKERTQESSAKCLCSNCFQNFTNGITDQDAK